MLEQVNLSKKVFGTNTYSKVIDNSFSELMTPIVNTNPTESVTVADFFNLYDQLFYTIPVSGSINSHTYLVTRSQQYIGGSVMDEEKQALIGEINSLKQQIINLNQTYLSINNVSS